MENLSYELQIMENSLLPFVFHKNLSTFRNEILNWHQNIEILYFSSGHGYVKYDTELYPVQAGELFIVNSYFMHAIISDSELTYDCLIIDHSFCENNGIPSSDIHFQELICDSELTNKFRLVAEAFILHKKCPDQFTITDIRHEILGLLRFLCRNYIVDAETVFSSTSRERIKQTIAYIKAHLTEPLSLEQLSEHVNVSKYHLSREFKLYSDMTIFDTINLLRCTKAKQLLEKGMSVSTAALSCGFGNLSYFTRTFKKHFGTTPSELRKHH
jgi:AraC-like DNA-binding protein